MSDMYNDKNSPPLKRMVTTKSLNDDTKQVPANLNEYKNQLFVEGPPQVKKIKLSPSGFFCQ